MGTRKYKIHVKRIRGRRIKKCRGFKRLVFKAMLISQPEYIVDGYNIIERSRIESRKINDLIYRNYLYKDIVIMLVNKIISITYDKKKNYLVGFNNISITDSCNNLFPILEDKKIKLLDKNLLNFPKTIYFWFKFNMYLYVIGNKKEFY